MQATQQNKNFGMYGTDIEAFIADLKASVSYRVSGANMAIAGLMSDAQEQIAAGDKEGARFTLNLAKALLFRVMNGELVGTVPR